MQFFNNVGQKIKTLAVVNFVILELVAFVLCFFVLYNKKAALLYIVIFLGATLVNYVVNMFIYGFGELVHKSCEIEENTRPRFDGGEGRTVRPNVNFGSANQTVSGAAATDYNREKPITGFVKQEPKKTESADRTKRLKELEELHTDGLVTDEEYKKKLENLHSVGLITDEEYYEKLSKMN